MLRYKRSKKHVAAATNGSGGLGFTDEKNNDDFENEIQTRTGEKGKITYLRVAFRRTILGTFP